MTVVLEDQVKTITAEIAEQYDWNPINGTFVPLTSIEGVVRAVIAMYDISDIGRQKPEVEVTPEMIEAGTREYYGFDMWSGGIEDRVEAIYRAMAKLARPVEPVHLGLSIDANQLGQAVVDHLKPVENIDANQV